GLEVLEIGKAVGEEIERKGLETVGLLGTRFTMERAYYKDTLAGFGVNLIVPSAEEMAVVDRIIFEELCKGVFREESRSVYKEVIKGLQVNGAEGVILGCTEIPLLIKESDADIAVFDTTAIHARAAVDYALA
ncbi:MAG TPA: amino acid racemase, partial [Mesotoga infera]|nr:amino acid racemase [Mesotoga infera]